MPKKVQGRITLPLNFKFTIRFTDNQSFFYTNYATDEKLADNFLCD